MGLENLAQWQKLAIEGEVAYILGKARHDAEALYFIYTAIKDVPADFAAYTIEVSKELISLPEDKIDRVVLEASLQQFPQWLWLDRTVSDIRLALQASEMEQPTLRTHVDKKEAKKMLIRSAFLKFCREVYVQAGKLSYDLCERVLEERDLDFLTPVATSFMQTYMWEATPSEKELNDSAFGLVFDIRNILSFMNEQKALAELIKCENDPEYAKARIEEVKNLQANREAKATVVRIDKEGKVTIENTTSNRETKWAPVNDLQNNDLTKDFDDLRKALTDKITELVNESITKKEEKKEKYLVSKDYGERAERTTLRAFDTKEEAEKFVEQMEKQFPELLNTCKFVISKG